jgi:dienelactone hydrolase
MNKNMIASIILSVMIIFSCMEKTDTPTQNLVEKTNEYTSDSTVMKGFLVYDSTIKDKRPGVLIVHEWWGLNDYARKRARMLAELGYTALALDMYGDGKQANHPDDAQKFAMSIFSNIKSGEERFLAAYNLLKSQETVDPNNIAAIGYCFGGGVVLHMARIGTDIKAVVSFHGGLEPVQPAEEGKIKATILVCNGADDPFVTQGQIDAFKSEMDK